MKTYFDNEKLHAYQKALSFAAWCEPVPQRIPRSAAVRNQLDRARTSIVLNLAEGNGKSTAWDKCRFFDNAHGSALESAACQDLLLIANAVDEGEVDEAETMLGALVGLITGLIKSKVAERFSLREDEGEYAASDGKE